MAIVEIEAKSILSTYPKADSWFGIRHSMNLYRGCQHQCIYCDSRSECYQIEDFRTIQVKINALELLDDTLRRKRKRETIGTGSMNDPYMPVEKERELTRGALKLMAKYRFPVHVITKSNLVLRDLDLLQEIAKTYAAVSFSITTTRDDLSRIIEPGAPPVSARLEAMGALAKAGIYTGVCMMPILPYITDKVEEMEALLYAARAAGAAYVLPAFGLTMRDRQRAYFYRELERSFPGLRPLYEERFGEKYACDSPNAALLEKRFKLVCSELGLPVRMNHYQPVVAQQLSLF